MEHRKERDIDRITWTEIKHKVPSFAIIYPPCLFCQVSILRGKIGREREREREEERGREMGRERERERERDGERWGERE